jgi:iron complex transport system substrate-binding protein
MFKTKLFSITMLITLLVISLAGCGPVAAQSNQPAQFTDGLGRTVTLVSLPKKIISLSPSNTEILYALNAGSQVIGRDEFSDYPAEAKQVTSVGGSMGKYNLEEITALQPDLVLAAEINTPEQVKSLEDLKITVYYLSNPKDIDGLYTNLETVGKLTGHVKEADALVASSKKRVDAVVNAKKTGQPVKVFYELDGSDPAKPWTAGKGTYVDILLGMAGGINIAQSAGESWIQMSQEAVITANPDIILLGDSAYGTTPATVAARPGWDQIGAVKNNAVYPFDDNIVSRPTPRIIDGLEKLAEIINK